MKPKLTANERRTVNAAMPIIERLYRQKASNPDRCPECGSIVDDDGTCEDCKAYVHNADDPPLTMLTMNDLYREEAEQRVQNGTGRTPIDLDAPLPVLTVNNLDDYFP